VHPFDVALSSGRWISFIFRGLKVRPDNVTPKPSPSVNRKRIQRVSRDAGLSVRRRPRKRVAVERVLRSMPIGVNIRWSMDVVSDAMEDGRKIRAFSVVDDFSRACPVIAVDRSLPGDGSFSELPCYLGLVLDSLNVKSPPFLARAVDPRTMFPPCSQSPPSRGRQTVRPSSTSISAPSRRASSLFSHAPSTR